MTLSEPLIPVIGIPTAIVVTVVAGLAGALLMFFVIIPVEWAARRLAPHKLSTLVRIFDRRAASAPCGLAICRGTLIGLALLGLDMFLLWTSTNMMGARLDSFALIYIQSHLFLSNSWPGPLLVAAPLFVALIIFIIVTFLVSLLARVMRGPWFALILAAVLSAAIFPVTGSTIGPVQPYYVKVLVLLFEFLILSWAFFKFDALTLLTAGLTLSFFGQNYALLVMLRPTGAFDERVAFAIWGLFVIAAAAVAFQSSLMSAYRRAAAAFQ